MRLGCLFMHLPDRWLVSRNVADVTGGSVEQRKMEETGFDVICSAPTTLAVKEEVKAKDGTAGAAQIRNDNNNNNNKKAAVA